MSNNGEVGREVKGEEGRKKQTNGGDVDGSERRRFRRGGGEGRRNAREKPGAPVLSNQAMREHRGDRKLELHAFGGEAKRGREGATNADSRGRRRWRRRRRFRRRRPSIDVD